MMRFRQMFLCLLCCCCVSAAHAGSEPTSPVVLMSDIHFDPFPDTCATEEGRAAVEKMLAAKATQWTAADFRLQTQAPALGRDSGYALMSSALRAAHAAAPRAKVVLIAGDMLEHGFREQFHNCLPAATGAQLTSFAAETVNFVIDQVEREFADLQVIPVLGNNDTDTGDYQLPTPAFLAEVGSEWKKMEKRKGRSVDSDFTAFEKGGYYSVSLTGYRMKVIATNSVLWSAKFSADGHDPSAPGDSELEWLQSTLLAADRAHERVVLLGHIPPGLDAYATRMARGTRIVTMYRECGKSAADAGCRDFAHAVTAMMARFSSNIAVAVFGHTHQNEFRVVGEGAAALPLQIVPSISPVFGNNPAFQIADVAAGFQWQNLVTWDLPLSSGATAWEPAFTFDTAYEQSSWNAAALQATAIDLKKNPAMRQAFFLRMTSGSAQVVVPAKWQDAYLCGLTNLSAERVLPCVAESQLDLPLP